MSRLFKNFACRILPVFWQCFGFKVNKKIPGKYHPGIFIYQSKI